MYSINSGWLLLGKTEDVDYFVRCKNVFAWIFGVHLNTDFQTFIFFFNAKLKAWGENQNSVPKEMKQNKTPFRRLCVPHNEQLCS